MACNNDNETTHVHQWKWVVTTPATTEAEGVETETCATCGETRGTRPIDRLPTVPNELWGTWICKMFDTGELNPNGYRVIYTANSETIYNKDDSLYSVDITSSTPKTNTTSFKVDEFPSGYQFSGIVVQSAAETLLVGSEYSKYLLLNATKDKFIHTEFGSLMYLEKQPN
jgi:hypothetical protein